MNQKILAGSVVLLGLLSLWNAKTMWDVSSAMEEIKRMESASLAIEGERAEQSTKKAEQITEKITELERQKKTLLQDGNSSRDSDVQSIDKQIKTLEEEAYQSDSKRTRTVKSKNIGMVMSALKDPNVKQEIGNIAKAMAQQEEASKWQAKKEVNSEARQFEMDNFAKEKGYSDSVTNQLNDVVSQYSEESSAIWRQVNDGEISWMDARAEWKDLKSERQTKLTDIIGEDDYKELQDRVWGKWR